MASIVSQKEGALVRVPEKWRITLERFSEALADDPADEDSKLLAELLQVLVDRPPRAESDGRANKTGEAYRNCETARSGKCLIPGISLKEVVKKN